MTNLKNNLRKVVAIAICLAGTTMFVQAQTPVTIDVSTLGGTDANNNAASTESNWQYNASQKRLHLTSANGNYTLTGTNADLCFDLGSGTLFATNANVTFNGLNTKGVTTPVGCYLSADGVTITLIGDNYLEGNDCTFVISPSVNVCTITSSAGGKLTAKGANGIYYASSPANLIIIGNANVSVGGTSDVFFNPNGTAGHIQMSDAAKFTIANNTNAASTQKFEKYVPASTYEWKLTNATTTNPLTDAIISVTVAAGQSGTVERATATSVENIELQNLKIYPNPVKDELIISSENRIENIETCDLAGRTVEVLRATPLQEGNTTINVSALPQGVYLVKVYTDKGIITKKVVKN